MQDLIPKMNHMIIADVDDLQRQRLENFLQLKKKCGEPKSDDEVNTIDNFRFEFGEGVLFQTSKSWLVSLNINGQ